MEKQNLEFFIENFFQVASQLFEHYLQADGQITDEQLIRKIRYERNQLLNEYGINSGDNAIQKLLVEIINKDHKVFLKNNGIDSVEQFVQSFVLGIAGLQVEEQREFIKCVSRYETTQELNHLYYFGHILDPMDVDQFTASFQDITRSLGMSQKAEILGTMAVFLENFSYESEGASFINKAQEYRESPELWFEQLIEKMYERSPLGLSIIYDYRDKAIKMKTQDSGLFDAQYLIRRFDDDVGSIQVSATSSLTSSFESDSVVRHALSNGVTSYFLNQYIDILAKNEMDKERDRLYRQTQSESGLESNEIYDENNPDLVDKNIEQYFEQIAKKFKKDFIEGYFGKLNYVKKIKNNGSEIDSMTFHNASLEDLMLKAINHGGSHNFSTLEQAVKHVNKDPTAYIQAIFDIPREGCVEQQHIDKILGNVSNNLEWYIFKPAAYFSSFHPTVSIKEKYKNASIVKDVFEKGLMTPEAFRSQSQFLGFLNYSTSELDTQCLYANGVWDNILKKEIKSRSQSNNNNISNSQHSELDIKHFENIVFEHFFYKSLKIFKKTNWL